MRNNQTPMAKEYPGQTVTKHLDQMVKQWDSNIVCRSEAGRFTGGLVSPKTLSNADALGKGPKPRFRYSGKVAYPATAIAEYLAPRLELEEMGDSDGLV